MPIMKRSSKDEPLVVIFGQGDMFIDYSELLEKTDDGYYAFDLAQLDISDHPYIYPDGSIPPELRRETINIGKTWDEAVTNLMHFRNMIGTFMKERDASKSKSNEVFNFNMFGIHCVIISTLNRKTLDDLYYCIGAMVDMLQHLTFI